MLSAIRNATQCNEHFLSAWSRPGRGPGDNKEQQGQGLCSHRGFNLLGGDRG